MIQSVILKALNGEIITNIHKLMERIWKDEVIPQDWNSALIFPVHKRRST
jgi:hypothetical protein